VRTAVAALAILVAACGRKDPSAVDEAYQPWQQRNFILSQTFSGGATLDGSIDIDASRDAGGANDWIEVVVNGNSLGRSTGAPRVSHTLKFRPGPNWIRFFSSASRLGWEFQIDARQGTRFEFAPKDKVEWTMIQVKDE